MSEDGQTLGAQVNDAMSAVAGRHEAEASRRSLVSGGHRRAIVFLGDTVQQHLTEVHAS